MPPRRNNANKRPKDLNAPKRPASAYILFNKSRQKPLKELHPDLKLTELTKLIGAEWKAMTDEQKAPFAAEANATKETYKQKLEEYKKGELYEAFQAKLAAWKRRQARGGASSDESDSDDDAPRAPVKPRKRPKDPNAPKKPLSAFFIFQTTRRLELKQQNPDTKNTELSKMTGAEWKAMDDETKKTFQDQAAVKRAEYQTRLEAYKKTDDYAAYQEVIKQWKEEQKAPKKAPKKKKKKKVRSPSPASSDGSETGSSGSDEEASSDEDGDTPMRDNRQSSSSGGEEEYSSSENDSD